MAPGGAPPGGALRGAAGEKVVRSGAAGGAPTVLHTLYFAGEPLTGSRARRVVVSDGAEMSLLRGGGGTDGRKKVSLLFPSAVYHEAVFSRAANHGQAIRIRFYSRLLLSFLQNG